MCTSAPSPYHPKGGTAMPHSVQERAKTPLDAEKAGVETKTKTSEVMLGMVHKF